MLQNKGIKNLSELKSLFEHKHKKEDFFTNFIDILKIGNKTVGFGKDAYYRLKNNSKVNWRIFLFSVENYLRTQKKPLLN